MGSDNRHGGFAGGVQHEHPTPPTPVGSVLPGHEQPGGLRGCFAHPDVNGELCSHARQGTGERRQRPDGLLPVRDPSTPPPRPFPRHDQSMNLYGEDCPTEAVDVPHSCSHQADDQAGLRPGRRIGYARVHSTEQSDLRETVQALSAAGVTAAHIHVDRGTRAPAKRRPAWRDALADLRSGDVLLVPSLAGLARS